MRPAPRSTLSPLRPGQGPARSRAVAAHPSRSRLWARSTPRPAGRAYPRGQYRAPRSVREVAALAQAGAPVVARALLGLVLAWFGYHELVSPRLWTGYVPFFPATSTASVVLVLAHGWALLVLAAALVAGAAPRLAASVTAVLLAEIVVSLTVSHGLSDLVLRDVGVLGLAVSVASHPGRARLRAASQPERPEGPRAG